MKTLVILAAFNGEKYIKQQLESILGQKDVDLDIHVFDDASTDTTVEIVKSFSTDKRITLSRNSIGTRSAANNFFKALTEMSSETLSAYDCISLSDQDDIWLPDKLKVALKKLQTENASLYGSNLNLWDEVSGAKSVINKSHPQKKFDYLFESGSAGCTYVFTKTFCLALAETIKKTNYLQWKFFSHDWFIYFFARLNNYKVVIDANAYIDYRMHSNNLHGYLNQNTFQASLERLKVIQDGWYHEHIKGFNQLLDENAIEKKIYDRYTKNYFSRLAVVMQYHFSLNRSFKKSIQFFIISALPLLKRKV